MIKAKNNRTLSLSQEEIVSLKKKLVTKPIDSYVNKTVHADLFDMAPYLPYNAVDLLIIDPPYNLNKNFGTSTFRVKKEADYEKLFEDWLCSIKHSLKKTASIYVCCDWYTSQSVYTVLKKYFTIRNRITWEREKGRGALRNWKNCQEDIWFATCSNDYKFNVDAVKLKRKVLAPYRINGVPKDWTDEQGGKYRLTFPSNLWTDITIPFWSMPENTNHPTQKPEKLIAKLVMASSDAGDLVLDPFVGSGTTSVVAKKLKRRFIGIDLNEEYCCLTEKRLLLADKHPNIQGYTDGFFWERNSFNVHKNSKV